MSEAIYPYPYPSALGERYREIAQMERTLLRQYDRQSSPNDPTGFGKEILMHPPKTQEEHIAYVASSLISMDRSYYDIVGWTNIMGWKNSTKQRLPRAWSPETIYRDPAYEFEEEKPYGQCGVTNVGLGLILAWSRVVPLGKLFYEEGSLVAASGNVLDDFHVWIRAEGDKKEEEWRLDLTAYQYDKNPDIDGHIRVAMQGLRHAVGRYRGVNTSWPPARIAHPDPTEVPNAYSLQYKRKGEPIPLRNLDATLFKGRLKTYIDNLGVDPVRTTLLGHMPPELFKISLNGYGIDGKDRIWYPDGYFDK